MSWEFPAWDPVIVELFGPLGLRWYGLSYVVAFICAHLIMRRLAQLRFFSVEVEKVSDLIFYTIIGTIAGGRIGYALFYSPDRLNPAEFIKVWEGGLSFHGGLIGVVIALILYSRKNGLRPLRVTDVCALAVTPGILAVRMANFINGELYGRTTTADTFGAMQFPTDPAATQAFGLAGVEHTKREGELAIQYAVGHLEWEEVAPRLSEPVRALEDRLDWDVVRQSVPYRHPSQLWEGFGEGILIGLVLFAAFVLTRRKRKKPGFFGGIFLIGYGVVRFFIEFLRQPDAQFRDADDPLGTVLLGMTMGQVLCVGMIVAGVLMMTLPKPDPEPGPDAAAPPGGTPDPA